MIKPSGPNRFGPSPRPLGFADAVGICLSKFVDFNGRAARSEFWWFYLATIFVNIFLAVLNTMFLGGLASLLSLVLWLPTLAVGARRLHDINRSGWWQLLGFSVIGMIVLIVLFAQPSQRSDEANVF
ncbi:DUF805 domain-containing protein [Asticcacaulis benevestitus]|uniref:DUF805 domain-containing protein n=1 Tax=Asticcacaulis benevestitus DSM 16100 = ATCC BAA-896 TaxID=1121022 RepID=V4PA39_9CAUL|nr:DUF805 domain-containing protein [Asticcacaulis benevestitus]ESQ83959.1 hypothetical protein ABENE_19765 [Asticcacaulis benevestitus DSM 16100 = ATCC BAA-896]